MQQLFLWGKTVLEEAHVPEPELDARYLFLDTWKISFASFLGSRNMTLPETEENRKKEHAYRELIGKRAKRIPLQHLLCVQEFMGMEFYVNENVLIPRQDTETLVELVLKEQTGGKRSLLDMCTGSGCIAVSLAKLGDFSKVKAVDISPEALKVAGRNAGALLSDYPGQFSLVESSMFEKIEEGEKFDVIVSNPPYIPTRVIDGLEPEVRDFEPRLALDGEADGLKFYRILAEKCAGYLNPGGAVYMEIGCEQAADVTALFEERGYTGLETVQDMTGKDRVVRALAGRRK
jgi:release factor glutamine methyltransferase